MTKAKQREKALLKLAICPHKLPSRRQQREASAQDGAGAAPRQQLFIPASHATPPAVIKNGNSLLSTPTQPMHHPYPRGPEPEEDAGHEGTAPRRGTRGPAARGTAQVGAVSHPEAQQGPFLGLKSFLLMKSSPQEDAWNKLSSDNSYQVVSEEKSRHAQNVLTSNSCGLSERECILCPFLFSSSPSPFSPLHRYFISWLSPCKSLGQRLRTKGRAPTKPSPPSKGPGVAKSGPAGQLLVTSVIKHTAEGNLHSHHRSSHRLISHCPYPLPPSLCSPRALSPRNLSH